MAALSGLFTGMGLCEVLTHIIKYLVLRRRPNFYALCGWDERAKLCTSPPKKILEAQLSFPSGHSSLAWCGMTYLVLVLMGRMQLLNVQTWRWWRQWAMWLVCLVPWSWAAYVAASRIVDGWHHASDVVAGSLLGVACAVMSYHAVFPPVFSVQAGTSFAELAAKKKQ